MNDEKKSNDEVTVSISNCFIDDDAAQEFKKKLEAFVENEMERMEAIACPGPKFSEVKHREQKS